MTIEQERQRSWPQRLRTNQRSSDGKWCLRSSIDRGASCSSKPETSVYCRRVVGVENLTQDHRIPLVRGVAFLVRGAAQ